MSFLFLKFCLFYYRVHMVTTHQRSNIALFLVRSVSLLPTTSFSRSCMQKLFSSLEDRLTFEIEGDEEVKRASYKMVNYNH